MSVKEDWAHLKASQEHFTETSTNLVYLCKEPLENISCLHHSWSKFPLLKKVLRVCFLSLSLSQAEVDVLALGFVMLPNG